MGIDKMNTSMGRAVALPTQGAAKAPAAETPPADKIAAGRQEDLKKSLGQGGDQISFLQAQMKQTIQNKAAADKSTKILLNCLEISRRIISGDKVPPKDHQYLMEHDRELYTRSILMRRIKEDPYEYDRLSEDEETEESGEIQGAAFGSDTGPETSAGAAAETAEPVAFIDVVI